MSASSSPTRIPVVLAGFALGSGCLALALLGFARWSGTSARLLSPGSERYGDEERAGLLV